MKMGLCMCVVLSLTMLLFSRTILKSFSDQLLVIFFVTTLCNISLVI